MLGTSKCYNFSITKLDWLKNKRALLIVAAVLFVVVIFSIKKSSDFKNNLPETGLSGGLTYDTTILKDLVSRDSDRDGIFDWEEGLWGTDPYNKDTNADGVTDEKEIARLKGELKQNMGTSESETLFGDGNLTQTDRFSQELLTTVAAINQTGEMDPATIQKLGEALATQIENISPKKVYGMTDIKITKDSSIETIQKYDEVTDAIFEKYPVEDNVAVILQELATADGDIDSTAVQKLEPRIQQMKNIIADLSQIEVSQEMATPHLNLINALERVMENLSDVTLIDIDAIVALSAISQYEENVATLDMAAESMESAISRKLNN